MAPPSVSIIGAGPMLFASSILFTLASSFIVRTKGNRVLNSALSTAVGQVKSSVLIPSGPQTVAHWEKYDGEHSFLEEVHGDAALTWVKDRSAHAIETLGNPESSALYNQALSILNSKDKIPYVSKIGDYYYNFWQDEANQRGLLRRTSLDSYKSITPVWETVLDVDLLGKNESESWVYKGYTLFTPVSTCNLIISGHDCLQIIR